MTHAINIILNITIALQTVGCSTWRPLDRTIEVSENDRQSLVRDQTLGKLTEGTRVKITIREGSRAPIASEVVDGIVETVSLRSLTLIPVEFIAPSDAKERLTLQYGDISSIEIHSVRYRGLSFFVAGVAIGIISGFVGTGVYFKNAG